MNSENHDDPGHGQGVSVTIGLATLNEERTIADTLHRLIEEKDSVGGEIIVVAGGDDRTVEIVESILATTDDARLIVDKEPQGKPSALNRIRSVAAGYVVVLSDGDVLVDRGSVRRLVSVFSEKDVGGASGRVIGSGRMSTPITRACDFMNQVMHLSRKQSYRQSNTIELESGYLIAVRRDLFSEVPPDVMSDDGYLSRHIRVNGMRIVYVEDAIVRVIFPRTLPDFVKQKLRTRYGHIQLNRLMPLNVKRGMMSEVKDLSALWFDPSVRPSRIRTKILAAVLVSLVWALVYLRIHVPFLFRGKIWAPVASTKST